VTKFDLNYIASYLIHQHKEALKTVETSYRNFSELIWCLTPYFTLLLKELYKVLDIYYLLCFFIFWSFSGSITEISQPGVEQSAVFFDG
jgi:hypothetical protein